ncbi:MAG: sulfatase-like hydrolase/transferase [Deltaproteobacteria bacterium]|nr:sulfatase-like hydrolase/transferase [Deltaproteobacteria bacterium]
MKPEFGVVRGFDSYTYFDRAPAEKVNAAAFKLIRSLKQGAQPFFLYLHYMDPHNPYKPPKEYAARYEGPLKTVEYPPRQVKFMSLYDGEIRYFDDHFGNLLSFLKQEGIYQDARIILASDHGEQFMEHGNQGHGYRLFNEELRVPLVIKGPGLKGHIDLPVSLLDLYPTVFDLVGFDPPRPHQGYSLVSELEQRAEHGLLSEVHRNFSSKAYLSPQGHKLILDYNLNLGLIPAANHPAELETVTEPGAKYGEELTSSNVSLKKELLSNFKDLYKETLNLSLSLAGGSKDAEVSVSKETLNELKSLGYVN